MVGKRQTLKNQAEFLGLFIWMSMQLKIEHNSYLVLCFYSVRKDLSEQKRMFYEITDKGVVLFLKVTPKASANKIQGIESASETQQVLKVMVTAVAENGKANEAVIKLISKFLKVPKSSCQLIKGETSRYKTILFSQNPGKIKEKLKNIQKLL